jgi:hypothetical protein
LDIFKGAKMKVYYKWNIPGLKWYERLYMNLTRTEVKEDAKHLTYTKVLKGRKFVDRLRK